MSIKPVERSVAEIAGWLQNADIRQHPPFHVTLGSHIRSESLFDVMMDVAQAYRYPVCFRAAWGLEQAFLQEPDSFTPYIDRFTVDFLTVADESVRRHYSKIMFALLQSGKWKPTGNKAILLAETVGDWLITPGAKVANKTWCLNILYHLRHRAQGAYQLLLDMLEVESLSPTPGMLCQIRKIRALLDKESHSKERQSREHSL